MKDLTCIIEALLIASEEPLQSEEIARLIRSQVATVIEENAGAVETGETPTPVPEEILAFEHLSSEEVDKAIKKLNHEYEASRRSFLITSRAKGWKIYTKPDFADFVRQLFPGQRPQRLSGPAMETLAITAYRQPITKAAIEAVRGVSCDGMLQKLLDLELIKVGGRAELPGRPLLYETTDLFFEHFGIRTIDDLPNASELRTIKLPEPEETTEGVEDSTNSESSTSEQELPLSEETPNS